MPVKSDKFIWKKYFILKAIHRGCIPDLLLYLIEKNEVYLSAKVEFKSPLEMAHLESRSLANQFRDACIKRVKKRYGDMFDLDIVECSSRENKSIQNRIKIDSDKIKQHLTAGSIAPNNRAKPAAMPVCKENLCRVRQLK
jgi:hypothetical protein